MIEIYITNTEAKIQNNDSVIELYGRTETGKADMVTVTGYEPHFYVLAEEAAGMSAFDYDSIERFEDTEFTGAVNNEELKKVILTNHKTSYDAKQHFDKTYREDFDYTDKFRVDHDIITGVQSSSSRVGVNEITPVEMECPPRVLTFDIETDDRGEGFPEYGEARILSIVAHDSYSDEYIGFLDLESLGLEDRFPHATLDALSHPRDLGLDTLDKFIYESNEKQMLNQFLDYIREQNFDLICGWNSNGFDTPFAMKRMDKLGIQSDKLGRGKGGAYLNWRNDPVISGRTCYDLMEAWKDTKFTKVSGALDDAAQMDLDDAKIDHSDKGFYELYDTDTKKFVNYNTQDTYLTVQLNEQSNVLSFKTSLRDTIGLDYEQTTQNNEFIEMMVRRKLEREKLVGPTADPPDEDEDFDGAYVFDAFSGLKQNIVGIDLASLYPNTLWMLNASPDTKVEPEETEWRDDQLFGLIDGEWIQVTKAANGVYFRLDEDGFMRELVDEALKLKEEAGRKKEDQSLTAEERDDWAEEYAVRKTIVNSIYGVIGWENFFLYDKDIAAAVTLTGQDVIKATADYVNNSTVASVAYGDTDSNYIEFPHGWSQEQCLNQGETICAELNNEVYKDLAAGWGMDTDVAGAEWPTRFEIELEMYASYFFQSGQKKFYAYAKTWEEGMPFEEQLKDGKGKISISGYPCIKSNTAPLTAQVQRDVLEAIVMGESKDTIREIVHEGAKSIDPANPDWDEIGIPGGLGKELENYTWTDGTPKGASPRAAFYGNLFVDGANFGKDDTVKRVYLNRTHMDTDERGYDLDVIGFERGAQLDSIEDSLTVDVPRMQSTLIESPMETILQAHDMDVNSAIEGQEQSGLSAFC